MASSSPPPRAKPLTMAMHGLAQLFDAAHQALAVAGEVAALDGGQAVHLGDVGAGHEGLAGPRRSAPPRARRRRCRRPRRRCAARRAWRDSGALSLSGRLSVIQRTAPRSSTSRLLKVMVAPKGGRGHVGAAPVRRGLHGSADLVSVAVQPCGGYPSAASGAPHRPGPPLEISDEVASVGCRSGGPWSECRHCRGPDRRPAPRSRSKRRPRLLANKPVLSYAHRLRPGQGPRPAGRRCRPQRRASRPCRTASPSAPPIPAAADGRPAGRPAAAHDGQGRAPSSRRSPTTTRPSPTPSSPPTAPSRASPPCPSGVQYRVIEPGTGAKPTAGQHGADALPRLGVHRPGVRQHLRPAEPDPGHVQAQRVPDQGRAVRPC